MFCPFGWDFWGCAVGLLGFYISASAFVSYVSVKLEMLFHFFIKSVFVSRLFYWGIFTGHAGWVFLAAL